MLAAPPPEEFVGVQGSSFYLLTGIRNPDGSAHGFDLHVNQIHNNVILFLLLTFMTPLRILRRSWLILVASAGILVVTHLLAFCVGVTYQMGAFFHTRGEDFPLSAETVEWLGYVSRIYGTIVAPVVPAFLVFPVWFWRRKRRQKPAATKGQTRQEKTRPNSPCPCGSGRKFKRCCGMDR